jgi:hypothetical protein
VQLQALFGFGARPIRLDFLVLLWPLVPFLWRRERPFGWLRPAAWRRGAATLRVALGGWARRWRSDPDTTAVTARREVADRLRAFLGLRA